LFVTDDSPCIIIPIILFGYLVFVWLFNNTNGSVLIAMLLHTSQNVLGNKLIGRMFSGEDALSFIWWMTLVYAVIACVILLTCRNRYLQASAESAPAMIVEPTQGHVAS
jgi:intracellular septation protein A